MRTVTFYGEKGRKTGTLHVEVPGCIVNVEVGLFDANGQPMTRVEVLADQAVTDHWHLPDFEAGAQVATYLGIRVVNGEKKPTPVLDLDEAITKHILLDMRTLNIHFIEGVDPAKLIPLIKERYNVRCRVIATVTISLEVRARSLKDVARIDEYVRTFKRSDLQ